MEKERNRLGGVDMVLEGWKKKKSAEEVDLIADYEMEWGDPEHWPQPDCVLVSRTGNRFAS